MQQKPPQITVNGHTIAEDSIVFELTRLVQFYSQHMPEDQVRAQLPMLQQRAIDQAIGSRLLFEEAHRRDLEVTDEEVAKRLEEMVERSGGRDQFDALLARQKLTEDTLREQIRRGRRVDKLVEQVVADAPAPTDADIRAHFDAHRDEYNRPERVLAQHILITPAGDSPSARQEARERIGHIRQRVLDGADFSDMASDNSDCPSGREGGSLGWFSRGMMVEAFEQAAFSLEKGGLSDIIETRFGFHLIYKTDHEPGRPAEFEEARDSICDFLGHVARGELLTAFVNELRSKARVEIDGVAAPATPPAGRRQ